MAKIRKLMDGDTAIYPVTDSTAVYHGTSKLSDVVNSKAPTNHKSGNTTYGTGDASNYGHLKLYDSSTSTYGVSNGYAATPKAVYNAQAATYIVSSQSELNSALNNIRHTGGKIILKKWSTPTIQLDYSFLGTLDSWSYIFEGESKAFNVNVIYNQSSVDVPSSNPPSNFIFKNMYITLKDWDSKRSTIKRRVPKNFIFEDCIIKGYTSTELLQNFNTCNIINSSIIIEGAGEIGTDDGTGCYCGFYNGNELICQNCDILLNSGDKDLGDGYDLNFSYDVEKVKLLNCRITTQGTPNVVITNSLNATICYSDITLGGNKHTICHQATISSREDGMLGIFMGNNVYNVQDSYLTFTIISGNTFSFSDSSSVKYLRLQTRNIFTNNVLANLGPVYVDCLNKAIIHDNNFSVNGCHWTFDNTNTNGTWAGNNVYLS